MKGKYTILIVDDVKINSFFLYLSLERNIENLNFLFAKNGKDAVAICKENPQIDLVFMNYIMPVMRGDVAISLIREFRNELPIIGTSALTTKFAPDLYNAGCSEVVQIPILPDKSLDLVLKYIPNCRLRKKKKNISKHKKLEEINILYADT